MKTEVILDRNKSISKGGPKITKHVSYNSLVCEFY